MLICGDGCQLSDTVYCRLEVWGKWWGNGSGVGVVG